MDEGGLLQAHPGCNVSSHTEIRILQTPRSRSHDKWNNGKRQRDPHQNGRSISTPHLVDGLRDEAKHVGPTAQHRGKALRKRRCGLHSGKRLQPTTMHAHRCCHEFRTIANKNRHRTHLLPNVVRIRKPEDALGLVQGHQLLDSDHGGI